MKVFVVSRTYSDRHNDCGEPLAAFSTKAEAQAYIDRHVANSLELYDVENTYIIVELDIDNPAD